MARFDAQNLGHLVNQVSYVFDFPFARWSAAFARA